MPIDRSVLADRMRRTGALIALVVERMAVLLKTGSSRLYVDETTAPVLDRRQWRPGRSGAHAEEILAGFDGTIQVDAYGGYDRLARKTRTGASRSTWRPANPTAGGS